MTPQDFFDRIAADRNLYGFDVDTEGKRAIVGIRDAPPGKDKVAVPFDVIGDNEWDCLRLGMLGEYALYGISRIVGYFSRHTSWNRSALASLNERREAVNHYANLNGIESLTKPCKGTIKEQGDETDAPKS